MFFLINITSESFLLPCYGEQNLMFMQDLYAALIKKKWITLPWAWFYYPNDIHMKLSSTLEE